LLLAFLLAITPFIVIILIVLIEHPNYQSFDQTLGQSPESYIVNLGFNLGFITIEAILFIIFYAMLLAYVALFNRLGLFSWTKTKKKLSLIKKFLLWSVLVIITLIIFSLILLVSSLSFVG
jgi:uncharacterized membrane protein